MANQVHIGLSNSRQLIHYTFQCRFVKEYVKIREFYLVDIRFV